jgi:hypothetical protein
MRIVPRRLFDIVKGSELASLQPPKRTEALRIGMERRAPTSFSYAVAWMGICASRLFSNSAKLIGFER